MSITWGVLAQSPEPEAHYKMLDNNQDRIGIWKCCFLRREENRRKTPGENPPEQRREPTKTEPTRATLVGGECSHHCAIPTLLWYNLTVF